jgi:hypothetical protein
MFLKFVKRIFCDAGENWETMFQKMYCYFSVYASRKTIDKRLCGVCSWYTRTAFSKILRRRHRDTSLVLEENIEGEQQKLYILKKQER